MQVPRKGIALAALSAPQRDALARLLATALSPTGAVQNANIQEAVDYLHSLGGQGANGFGALVDYFVAIYSTPHRHSRSWSSSAGTTSHAT